MNSPTSTSFQASADSLLPPDGPDSGRSVSPKSSPTPAECSPNAGQACPISETCELPPTLPGFEDAPLSAQVFHASRFPRPGSKEAKEMCAGSGRQLWPLSRSPGPLGLLVKTCLASLEWGCSTKYAPTWRTSVTARNRLLFRLAVPEPGMCESESGFLPTLTVQGNHNRKGLSKKSGDGISTAIKRKFFPALLAADAKGGIYERGSGGSSLRTFLPTLCARDHIPAHTPAYIAAKKAQGHGMSILTDYFNGPLNPRWCEWFMGYPIGHTELKDSATPSSRKLSRRSSNGSRKSNEGRCQSPKP
jgi:hypothetical protein